jgi:hypothetical protein
MYWPLVCRAEPQPKTGKASGSSASPQPGRRLSEKIEKPRDGLAKGVRWSATHCVEQAVEDWLGGPMADRAGKTLSTQRDILAPLTEIIGKRPLRELEADEVSKALIKLAVTRSTRSIRDTRASFVRIITYTQARGLVGRNVVALIKARRHSPPAGRASR